MTPTATPTPIPALAPELSPLFSGTTVLVADAGLVAGLVGLDVVEMVEEEVDADVVKLVEAGAVVLVTAWVKLKL